MSTTGSTRTVEGIATSAAEAGYAITLLPVAVPTQRSLRGAFTRLGELAVDAVIIIMGVHLLDSAAIDLPPGIPVVVADYDAGASYSVVDTDQRGGARAAVQHLLDLGHRTVWHVAGPAASFAAQRREESWEATLRADGLDVPPVVRGAWTPESGYRAGLRLADEANCTAVFAANDEMALGVLRAMHERNRAVPVVRAPMVESGEHNGEPGADAHVDTGEDRAHGGPRGA